MTHATATLPKLAFLAVVSAAAIALAALNYADRDPFGPRVLYVLDWLVLPVVGLGVVLAWLAIVDVIPPLVGIAGATGVVAFCAIGVLVRWRAGTAPGGQPA